MQKLFLIIIFTLLIDDSTLAQGLNHQFLLGYSPTLVDTNNSSPKARLLFTSNSYNLIPETRKMAFYGTQGNISDINGNLLMVSNGCWISNSLNDTMLNGSGLNPNVYTNSWCTSHSGLPAPHLNVFLPFPDSSHKYILFHQTGGIFTPYGLPSELYYSLIDMTLDSGRGGVTQKNVPIIANDTLEYGIAACRHANGRDWWIVALKDSSDLVYKVLLTPDGIDTVTSQHLGVFPFAFNNVYQPTFSPDGKKFAYTFTDNVTSSANIYHDIRLFDFDRCSGLFSNPNVINVSDSSGGLAVAFSPNSQLLYSASFKRVFQININTLLVDTVAINDGFYSPQFPFQTDFWTMYLAANGKIYISSGSSVVDMHYIDNPDILGVGCNVMQHALHLPCYYVRGHVYHPNYYLGCDTTSGCTCLATSLSEIEKQNFNFSVSPNPSNGNFKIMYLLPQNKSGTFQILDITGKQVFKSNLPQWSTLQNIDVDFLKNGVYSCLITSNNFSVNKKVVIIH